MKAQFGHRADQSESGQMAAHPWAQSVGEIKTFFNVEPESGLSASEVIYRRTVYGSNQLREHKARSSLSIAVAQFKSLIVALLGAAAIVAFLFDEPLEGSAILAVILINAALGFVTEHRALRSMEALYELGNERVRVRRESVVQEIVATELVPGDIVILEGGDVVTADVRILTASKLQADESMLTGESVPVSKQPGAVQVEAPLAERHSILFKGTAITRGAGEGVVVTTGLSTELGKISSLVVETVDESTPLEKRLDKLGRKLIAVTLVVAPLVTLSGVLGGKQLFLMVEIGLALAVAAIPEGLPIVATLVLARGIKLMARRNALVTRLSSVETLGSVGVIFLDKTGTLTENRMTLVHIALQSEDIQVDQDGTFRRGVDQINVANDRVLLEALETGVLCNNAAMMKGDSEAVGDPLEAALLEAGAKADLYQNELRRDYEEIQEEAFDPDIKMMSTIHRIGSGVRGESGMDHGAVDHLESGDRTQFRFAIKGAPEEVLAVSSSVYTENGSHPLDTEARTNWLKRNNEMAAKGLRVLALATRRAPMPDQNVYENLTFIGLVGLLDPPRKDVYAALESCRSAGIRLVMVTGDQPATAVMIARETGLIDTSDSDVILGSDLPDLAQDAPQSYEHILNGSIFARVTPKQKLDLIELYQRSGLVVAMTGDGVNDAPALKKSDIGIAMGGRGTQVAREAADMVLQDDALSTIVVGVEQGRIIFGNIRRFVFYLLSCNVSELMVVALATLVSAPLPILPLQVLFLNLVTDVFPALALGMGKSEEGVMAFPPRNPSEPILDRRHWRGIAGFGAVITAAVLCSFALALLWLDFDAEQAVTVSFLTLALAQLWHVFNMRGRDSSVLTNEVTRNPYVWGALVLCIILILCAVYIPHLASLLGVQALGSLGWGLVLTMSLVPLIVGQVVKVFASKLKTGQRMKTSFGIA